MKEDKRRTIEVEEKEIPTTKPRGQQSRLFRFLPADNLPFEGPSVRKGSGKIDAKKKKLGERTGQQETSLFPEAKKRGALGRGGCSRGVDLNP